MNNKNQRLPLFFNTFPYASSLNAFTQRLHETSPPPYPPKSPKKKVSFFNSVAVILIPERKEYAQANLNDVLWFNEEDYQMIKQATVDELNEYIQENPHVTKRKALNLIYGLNDVHPENLRIK